MDLDDFYVLGPQAHEPSAGWRWLELSRRVSALGPDGEEGIWHELVQPVWPVPFRVISGHRCRDIYGTSEGVVVYSGRLARALQEAGCTGFRSFPAVLYDESDSIMIDGDLRWIVPTHRAGPVEEGRGSSLLGDVDYLETDPDYSDAFGLYFDVLTWPGTDLFRLKNERDRVLVTRNVVDVIENGSFEGIQAVPVRLDGKDLRDAAIERRKLRKAREN